MEITVKQKIGNKFQPVPFDLMKDTTEKLRAMTNVAVQLTDNGAITLASDIKSLREDWINTKHGVMIRPLDSLCDYLNCKFEDFVQEIFRPEYKEERIAIMEAEKVPQETIRQVIEQYPLLYNNLG